LDGVQQLQANYLDAGFEAKVFAYQRRDSTTDLSSNMNTQLENEEASTADHSQTEAVDLSSTGSTTGPDSRKVSNEVGQEDRHGSTSQVNEGWMRHVEQFIAKPGDQHGESDLNELPAPLNSLLMANQCSSISIINHSHQISLKWSLVLKGVC
jgi:hypothetical protein